jgi:hypothetical protein
MNDFLNDLLIGLLIGAFDDPEPPFIGKVFGTIIGLILLVGAIGWLVGVLTGRRR